MRIETLKNPGTFSGGQKLRATVARAISFAEVTTASRTDGEPSGFATSLASFLYDAATKTPGYDGPAPIPSNAALVTDGQTFPSGAGTITASVVDGVLTLTYAG